MNKKNKQQVPKIRFEGYQNQWKEDSLITIADYVDYRGKTPTKTEEGVLLVTAKNIRQGYIDYSISQEYIAKSDYDSVMSRGKVRINDVLITTEAPLGNVALVDKEGIALAQRVIKYRGKEGVLNNLFLKSCLLTNTFQNALASKATGGTVQGIKGSTLHKQHISYSPDIEEQTKIGNFFQQLDKLIELQTHAVESAEIYKKAMLQKMFPQKEGKVPRVRFEGFSEDWERGLLGDLMDVTSVRRIHQADWTDEGIRFLRARDIVAFKSRVEVTEPLYISNERYEEYSKTTGKVEVGHLLVTGVGTIGVSMLIENDNPLYFKDGNVIWFKNNVLNGYFFNYSFSGVEIQNFIKVNAGTGTVGTYTIDSGKKTPIKYPSLDEQTQIGNFFQKLDQNIESEKKKLEQYQTMKRALLQRMFV